MAKIKNFKEKENLKVLNTKETIELTGGGPSNTNNNGNGWGVGGSSNGHGCPPPFEEE